MSVSDFLKLFFELFSSFVPICLCINKVGIVLEQTEKWRSDFAKFSLPDSGDDSGDYSTVRPQTTKPLTCSSHGLTLRSTYKWDR